MPRFFFHPSARLQRFLGRQLIADPNIAIAEFVKNAYDAGAKQVYIDFWIEGRSKEDQVVAISDDGTGMDEAAFKENWMRPGFSYKARVLRLVTGSEGRLVSGIEEVDAGNARRLAERRGRSVEELIDEVIAEGERSQELLAQLEEEHEPLKGRDAEST